MSFKSTKEHRKEQQEMEIFQEFLAASLYPIDPKSAENRKPPEPDILCMHNSGKKIAFELVEICDQKLANSIANKNESYIRTSDPTQNIIIEKLNKKYQTDAPIELLCYTLGRTVSPDELIILTIENLIFSRGTSFSRVWLFGRKGNYQIWSRAEPILN